MVVVKTLFSGSKVVVFYTWEIGYKPRLVEIAHKLHSGEALTNNDKQYLWYWRQKEQKRLELS